jgi:hypothetical protein
MCFAMATSMSLLKKAHLGNAFALTPFLPIFFCIGHRRAPRTCPYRFGHRCRRPQLRFLAAAIRGLAFGGWAKHPAEWALSHCGRSVAEGDERSEVETSPAMRIPIAAGRWFAQEGRVGCASGPRQYAARSAHNNRPSAGAKYLTSGASRGACCCLRASVSMARSILR